MPRLFNFPRWVVWGVLVLAAALLVAFVILFANLPRSTGLSYTGAEVVIPIEQIFVTLVPEEDHFAGTFPEGAAPVAGFVVVDPKDAVAIAENRLLVPFIVNRAGDGATLYVGLFSHNGTNATFINAAHIADGAMLDHVEVRSARGGIIWFVKEGGPNGFTYIVFSTDRVHKAYEVVNAAFGDVYVDMPAPNAVIEPGSTIAVVGGAKGWYFEASFPVTLLDDEGQPLVETFATAQRDWMTAEEVPYTAEVVLPAGYTGVATLVLMKDNPSGLPEHDASLVMPLVIADQ